MRPSFLLAWSSRLLFASLVAASLLLSVDAVATPNLPFGDINVVILTDIHSWLGGHRRHEKYDADLGDVLSFWEQLKVQCEDKDLFLVNNGDFVDGTGLSERMDAENNPEYLIPLLEKMPYDAVNVGNHELYSKKNIAYMTRPGGYVDWWGDRYLTSNINRVPTQGLVVGETKDPLGYRYKVLHGKNSSLLVFGFLYNMRDYAHDAGIEIEKVGTTVQQQWFLDALSGEDYDAILVLAHMDLVDPLVDVVRLAIRDAIGDSTAVVFATGHTHYRGFKQLDNLSITFEAGRYMDTVGFVSFPRKDSITHKKNTSSVFGHKYLDANKKVLFEDTLGFENAEDGKTKDGEDFSNFIDHTRAKLGLDREIGCAPMSYYVSHRIDAPDSLWGLYRDEVIPKLFTENKAMKAFEEKVTNEEDGDDDLPYAMLLSNGGLRYNLYSNASVVVDDVYAISPFNDTVIHMGIFSAETILEANRTLNKHHYGKLPSYILIGDLVGNTPGATKKKHHLYTHEFSKGDMKRTLEKISPSEPVVMTKTKYTSTLFWLAFVEKYWPCDGATGKLPYWFPNNNLDPERGNFVRMKSNIDSGVWIVLAALIMLACFACYDAIERRQRREEYKLLVAAGANNVEIPCGLSESTSPRTD